MTGLCRRMDLRTSMTTSLRRLWRTSTGSRSDTSTNLRGKEEAVFTGGNCENGLGQKVIVRLIIYQAERESQMNANETRKLLEELIEDVEEHLSAVCIDNEIGSKIYEAFNNGAESMANNVKCILLKRISRIIENGGNE